jgi:hypothetical protein
VELLLPLETEVVLPLVEVAVVVEPWENSVMLRGETCAYEI